MEDSHQGLTYPPLLTIFSQLESGSDLSFLSCSYIVFFILSFYNVSEAKMQDFLLLLHTDMAKWNLRAVRATRRSGPENVGKARFEDCGSRTKLYKRNLYLDTKTCSVKI